MADSSSESDIDECSGITQPTLLEQLKKILDEYRNDVQIIKELVQNADDAGASEMKILYVGKSVNENSRKNTLTGPAFVFYNDAEFSESDWRGIKSIYSSEKKDDPLKVGRFGLGFKSVFHMTDKPCIISGENILIINPLEEDNKQVCTTVKLKNLKQSKRLDFKSLMNALNGTFGFSEETITEGRYTGTLFWFSLRQTPSKLSSDKYHAQQVNGILEAFIEESCRSLTFLKTLCSVEMFVELEEPMEDHPPQKRRRKYTNELSVLHSLNYGRKNSCYHVKIYNANEEQNTLIDRRKETLKELETNGMSIPKSSKHWVFDVIIETSRGSNENCNITKSRWLIVTYLKGKPISSDTSSLLKDKSLQYPPIVSLAAPVSETCEYDSICTHVFCYQPLPQENSSATGLPVHINAFFALSQNRRHILWPDIDGDGHLVIPDDNKIKWNMALITELLPYAYSHLCQEMVDLSKIMENKDFTIKAVYNVVPDLTKLASEVHWMKLAEKVVVLLDEHSIIYTESNDGVWIKPREAIIMNEKKFLPSCIDAQDIVYSLLCKDNINVTNVPENVLNSLQEKCHTQLIFVSPKFLKEHLHGHKSYLSLDLNEKIQLVQFVLLDQVGNGLENIELLPLANDEFTSFAKGVVYVEPSDVVKLFPDKEHLFLHDSLNDESKETLKKITVGGKHNVRLMNVKDVEKLLGEILQGRSVHGQESITIQDKKWIQWIEKIWIHIEKRYLEHIDTFKNLPLFPIIDAEESKVVLISLKSLLLHFPDNKAKTKKRSLIAEAFQFLSVSIVKSIPKWIPRIVTDDYLCTETEVFKLLERVDNKEIDTFNDKTTEEHSSMFLSFLSDRPQELLDTCRNKLRRMRLFKGGIKPDQHTLLAINECNDLYSGCRFPVSFPKNVVFVKSKNEEAFAKSLGGKIISEIQLINLIFQEFNSTKYSLQDKDTFIEWVIQSKHFHDVDVQCSLKKIAFVKRKDGKLCTPSQLFDPDNTLLVELFKNRDVFPVGNLNTKRLKKLGLKTDEHISESDIHGLCDDIDKQNETKGEICKIQCQKLLEIMEKLSMHTDEQYLLNKRCILIEKDGNQFSLHSPSEIKSTVFSELIDTEMCLIDSSKFPKLSKRFNWDKAPTHQQVVKHFFNVVESYTDKLHANYLPKVMAIYRHLSQCGEDIKGSLYEQFSSIGNKFVWTENGFQSPEHVYTEKTDRDIDLNPFFQVIPPYLSELADFFRTLGCRRTIDADMYLNTLEEINSVCENGKKPKSDKVLMDMAISILNKLKEDHLDYVKQMTGRIIYFPVQNKSSHTLLMRPASKCAYCDAHWLKNMDFDVDDDIEYVHEKVLESTAEALGVPSLRQQMLANSDAFEEWGQEEPLTRRLRNILTEDYVDGFSVAKELLQNADDAGASSLKIMYDDRENNDTKTQLLSESMAELQGRAIWVYNDALFTQDDLKNITKIHGGTKESDCSKIGRFGLGFCAVYNVTDVPMFISGSNLVIFDPHTTYLGSALPGKNPGLRINFESIKNQKLLKRLRNQFRPFDDVFDCHLTDTDEPYFNGSLFRLPLRNKASDICDSVYTEKKVQQLFDTIMKLSSNMLLFNQSVKSIELYHLNKKDFDASKPVKLFTASKQILDSDLPHSILKVASERKKEDALRTKPLTKIEALSIDVNKMVNKSPMFSNVSPQTFQCNWLVSWSTGNQSKLLEMSKSEKGALPLGAVAVPLQSNGRNYNIISLDSVPDHFYQQGHFFVFLPLPIEHNLPFHINGQFSVTSDRQFLRTSSEGERNVELKEWNECLIEDAVTKSFLYLLIKVRSLVDLSIYDYKMLWPTTDISTDASSLLKKFPHSFFQHIVHNVCYDVFEKDGQWFDISKCVFIEPSFRNSDVGRRVYDSFRIIILSPDEVVVDIPDKIYRQILSADTDLIQEKTMSDVSFFMKYFLPQFDRFDGENSIGARDCLVRYAIQLNNPLINELLTSTACIPSKPIGILKRPCQLVDETSDLSKLFSMCDGYFPKEVFSDSNMYLRNLGMKHDELTDDMVLVSANSVQKIQNECCECAFKRCSDLLDYLSDKDMDLHEGIMTDLQQLEFVPVMSKPKSWSFKWKSESCEEKHTPETTCTKHKLQGQSSVTLGKPQDLYHWSCKALVGSVSLVLHEGIHISNNSDLLNALGIQSTCDLKIVLKQLQLMSETFTCGKGNGYTTSCFVADIYKFLNKACIDEGNSRLIRQQLNHKTIVYVEAIFTCPEVVAKTIMHPCTPHLYDLQRSPLKKYAKLCDCLGIKQEFSAEVFSQTLKKIKESVGDHPVQENDIETILNLLKCLQYAPDCSTLEGIVYGPDEERILRDCTKMCFDDLNEMKKSETMKFAHPKMSKSLAKAFGVKPKLLYSMDENSEDIEDFYQEEPLITRIKNLIEGYPCDVGVFKELLQNADDAKATELHFLLDYDTHPSNKIFYDEYRKLQGPALCVFNNSAFSNDDLRAITRLGRGNKSEDLFQTGRYGVGFNAVYNLTDVPSFLTWGGDIENNETLCFFDPMANFIPSVKKSKPGKRYKDVASIREFSNDVLKGFHEKFFKENREKGSVFRFPLRGKDLAKESEITNDPIEVEQMDDLLVKFSKELKRLILFLKHINIVEITIHRQGKHLHKFQIEREMTGIHSTRYSEIVQAQSDLSKSVSGCPENMLTIPFQSWVCEMALLETDVDETHTKTEYIAVHTLGFKYQDDIPGLLRENIRKRKVGFLPSGAVAIKKEPNLEVTDECFAYCFLPLPVRTGFPVQVHGYFALDNETRRTLWQSDHQETCYKTIWNIELLKQVIAPAYSSLIDYIRESICIPNTCQNRGYDFVKPILRNYLAIFPTSESASDFYWKQLSQFVYKDLVRSYIPFLPILKTYKERNMLFHKNELFGVLDWTPLHVEGHTFPAYRNDEPNFDKSTNQFKDLELLERIKLRSVTISDDIQHSMKEAECEIETLAPGHIIKFVSSFNSQLIDRCCIEVEQHVKQTILGYITNVCELLRYCLNDQSTFLDHLFKIPLFITNDGVVHTLPQDGHLIVERNKNFCSFFPTAMERFLDSNVSAIVSYKIQSYTRASKGVLVPFTLQRFMHLVNETGVIQTDKPVLSWNMKSPGRKWIQDFWSFFYSTFSNEPGYGYSELRESVFQHLRMINELPVIPVCEMESQFHPKFLVSPACIKQLINLDSFVPGSVHGALKQVNILQLNVQVLPIKDAGQEINTISVTDLLKSVLPDISHPDEVLTCLHLNLDKLRQASLSAEKSTTILRYFSDTSLTTNIFPFYSLKELPIFTTYFGDIVSLKDYSVICVLPLSIPTHGLKELAQTSNVLFLKDIGLKNLYTKLGINEKSLVEVYVRYIIPNYGKMESSAFYEHIRFLARHLDIQNVVNGDVLNILKTTPFITVGSNALLVGNLLDPTTELFKRMCDEKDLVPLVLRDVETLHLLRQIGLQTTLTMPLLKRFSNSIQDASQVEGNHKLLADNSECLLRHLFKMPESFFLENNFDSVRKIKFVKALKVGNDLQAIHPQYTTSDFISFEGSVLSSAMLSSWTSSKLLPEVVHIRWRQNSYETILSKLDIRDTPKFDELVIHCKHVGMSASDRRKRFSHDRLHDVMCHIYKCMESLQKSKEINETDFLQLCDVPIIYHKNLKDIFSPKQTVLYCKDEEEVPPYISKCPSENAQYHDLFRLLGCWKEPCFSMYARVLLNLREHTDESGQLFPKQLADAIKAFSLMFKHFCEVTSPIPETEQNLYLLTDKGALEMANRLIVDDRKYLSSKIVNDTTIKCTFLHSFGKLHGVNLSTDKCIESLKYLPENMKPHLLTDIAKHMVIMDNIQYIGDEGIANSLNEFIHGRQFVYGYLRLARHALKHIAQGDSFKQWGESDEKNTAGKVTNIRFKHVTGIKTKLFFQCVEGKDAGKKIAVQNTEEQRFVHLEEKDDEVILYFDTSDYDWYKKVRTEIALYLNGLVNKCLQGEHFVYLMEILEMKDSQSNISNYLDKNSIEEYKCTVEIDENPIYPTPGTFVPRKWHQYLDNDYGIFQHYDYKFVALEVDDPALNESDNNDDDDENDNTDNEKEGSDLEPTYMFVHIISKSDVVNDFPLLQEYIINDGSETTITVPAYRLYKFVCKGSDNASRQIVLHNRQSSSEEGTSIDSNDLKKTRKEIREYLNTAWKQTETVRRKLVIRLLRKWHPDKNPDNVDFCTKVFQYIQQCLRRLEKGQRLLEDDDETKSYHHSGSRSSYSGSFWQSSWYGRYWKRHYKRRQYYDEFDGFSNFQGAYRWISEARRWFKQASFDQENARKALEHGISFNWVCYMSHQAGEKSIKAAWYGKDANKILRVKWSHQLTWIASGLNSMIQSLATELSNLTGDHTRMRYPDTVCGQAIPSTVYTKETAEAVISKAQQILDCVKRDYID